MLLSCISALMERFLYKQSDLVTTRCITYNLMQGYSLWFMYLSVFIKFFTEAINVPDLLLINGIIIP